MLTGNAHDALVMLMEVEAHGSSALSVRQHAE